MNRGAAAGNTVAENVELRVHGVGGPQGPKILGWRDGSDVVTLPPTAITYEGSTEPIHFPPDSGTRFVRPLHPEPGRPVTEAYEWGGLTMGSLLTSLWVVFLPFTLLNVAGWARTESGNEGPLSWYRDLGARLLGYLGTATYVLWFAYIFLELAGLQWRARLLYYADVGEGDTIPTWIPHYALPLVAAGLFVGVLVVLAIVNRKSGERFECANPDRPPETAPVFDEDLRPLAQVAKRLHAIDRWLRWAQVAAGAALGACMALVWTWIERPVALVAALVGAVAVLGALAAQRILMPEPKEVDGQPPQHWNDRERVTHPDFFAHHRSLDRLRHRHTVLGAAIAGFCLAAMWTGRPWGHSRIGLSIVLLANIQVAILVLVWVYGALRRRTRLVRAGMLTLGTVLCHAAFAGTALWLRNRLSSIPDGPLDPPLPVGVELKLNGLFAFALALAAVPIIGAVVVRARPGLSNGIVVKIARRVPITGTLVSLAFVAPFAIYSVSVLLSSGWREETENTPWHDWHDIPRDWYEARWGMDDLYAWQTLGSKALLLLPVAFALALRSGSTAGKVLGNLWDVLTFWPRRYHPFAVPPYAERAVPELRARVGTLLDRGDGVILSGHSQGSVVSVAAIGSLLPTVPEGRLHLLTYGSPLGTMYAPVFPAAFGRELQGEVREALAAREGHWTVLWRLTDPIGGPVFGEEPLPDPPPGPGWENPPGLEARPPLDRPPPWGVKRGHGHYCSEPQYREAVERAVQRLNDAGV